jgi:hypothetical protein
MFTSARYLSLYDSHHSSTSPHPIYWRSILIIYFHLSPCFKSWLLPPGYQTKSLNSFRFPHIRHMPRLSHSFLFDYASKYLMMCTDIIRPCNYLFMFWSDVLTTFIQYNHSWWRNNSAIIRGIPCILCNPNFPYRVNMIPPDFLFWARLFQSMPFHFISLNIFQ